MSGTISFEEFMAYMLGGFEQPGPGKEVLARYVTKLKQIIEQFKYTKWCFWRTLWAADGCLWSFCLLHDVSYGAAKALGSLLVCRKVEAVHSSILVLAVDIGMEAE